MLRFNLARRTFYSHDYCVLNDEIYIHFVTYLGALLEQRERREVKDKMQ